ncbi:MAG: alkane 1-monooxygenase [Planctomycetota bacterium]
MTNRLQRMPRALFTAAYALPLLHLAALQLRGPFAWVTLVYVFVAIPLLDGLIPAGPPDDDLAEAMPRTSRFHDLLLELWFPVQVALTLWTLHAIEAAPPSGHEWAGLVLSLGLVAGAGGITIGHELMHRPSLVHRALGEALMTSVYYAHFCVEHVLGHHKRVATHSDPASARRGEWIYAFYVRAVAMGLVSAWRLETRRVERLGIKGTLRDRRLRMGLTQLALGLALLATFGPAGLAFHVAHALFAVLLLETVDYIEHYGLVREEITPGKHERVRPHHSWNSAHRVSSAHIFQLPRHSDHHANASRPYYRLRTLPGEAPVLPAGYPTMMLTALAPPLFFRIVDPLIEAHGAS